MVGKDAPSEKVRAILERCQLFLTTDLPFEWPEPKTSVLSGILNLFSFGSIAHEARSDFENSEKLITGHSFGNLTI